ncbi:cytochrome P450 [Bisporella sp. PMI_857]|nr:cytochrome P450 [Bisporella sp. PMI_857]
MLREIVYGFASVVLLAYAVEFLLSLRDDSKEPPRVRPRVPLIGHLLGLVTYGTAYYNKTSKRTDSEMYTLGIFSFKIYVSNSRRLIPLIQKSSKTISFKPFVQLAAVKLGNASNHAQSLFVGKKLDGFRSVIVDALLPGPYLDEQNLRMGDRLLIDLYELLNAGTKSPKQIKLMKWARHTTLPRRTWNSYASIHFGGLDILGGPGYAAREKVFESFRQYFGRCPQDVAQVSKERVRFMREMGYEEEDVIKQETAFSIATFPNTTSTLYWTICELFARQELLVNIREEVISGAVSGSKKEGFILDVAAIKSRCPLLLSMFEETQRMRHNHANIRTVLEDTLLDSQYLLKRGAYVQIPGRPVHYDSEIWGHTSSEFDPYRFVPEKGPHRPAIPPSAFLAWGAPPHLCPARQFAATEILITVALLAVRADLRPSSGIWGLNAPLDYSQLSVLLNPKEDIEIDVMRREDWAGDWTLKTGESLSKISLASG